MSKRSVKEYKNEAGQIVTIINGVEYVFPATTPETGKVLTTGTSGAVTFETASSGPHSHAESEVTNLVTDLSGKASASDLSTHAGLSTTAHGGIVAGNDSRLSDARTPTSHGSDKHSVSYESAGAVSTHEGSFNHSLLHSNSLDHSNSQDHGHSNKSTLDTYTQTEANLADAVSKKHSNSLDHAQAHAVTTHSDWPANASGYLANNGSGTLSWGNPGGGATPAWKGAIAVAWKDGDPHWILDSMLHNPVHATPTNISITVARCAFFKLDTALTVQKIRWFGVGATTGLYHVAVYRVSDNARMAILDDFNTAAQTWGSGAFSCTLAAGILYLLAVSVDTTGTTAGVACHSGTTGRIGVLPTGWPGNLDIDAASPKIDAMGFCQIAVTAGALPATLPTKVLQAAWTGGMPAFFLDNNNG